jgi:hypothetical protein
MISGSRSGFNRVSADIDGARKPGREEIVLTRENIAGHAGVLLPEYR